MSSLLHCKYGDGDEDDANDAEGVCTYGPPNSYPWASSAATGALVLRAVDLVRAMNVVHLYPDEV